MVKKEERRIEVPDLKRKEYETRLIVLAQGIQGHDEDIQRDAEIIKKNPKQYPKNRWSCYVPPLDFLSKHFKGFEIVEDQPTIKKILSEHKVDGLESVRKIGRYTSDKQKVKFVIILVVSKKDYKRALETEGPPFLHVIYAGHSRYGRGACFDTYKGVYNKEGDQWGSATFGKPTGDDIGLFRLGYPYVPVTLGDIEKHKYHFAPVPVEEGVPPNEKRHPYSRHRHARKSLRKVPLPFELQLLVWPSIHDSSTDQYYGLTDKEGARNILLHAGWTKTRNDPYDLGATKLKCRVFCHFGCSSRLHFWHIVRREEYKGWKRPKPPTDKYAYFTNAPSDKRVTNWWLYYILAYDKRNDFKPWWDSLEEAKKKAGKKLERIGFPKKMIY